MPIGSYYIYEIVVLTNPRQFII